MMKIAASSHHEILPDKRPAAKTPDVHLPPPTSAETAVGRFAARDLRDLFLG